MNRDEVVSGVMHLRGVDAFSEWRKDCEARGTRIPLDSTGESAMISILSRVVVEMEREQVIPLGEWGFEISGFRATRCPTCNTEHAPTGDILFAPRRRSPAAAVVVAR